MWFYLLINIFTVFSVVYFYITHKYSYWSKKGVLGPKPSLLSFGNTMQTIGHPFPPKNEVDLVRKYGPIYGTFTGLEPTLTVADPEALKHIFVKDFQYFINRRKPKTYHEIYNICQLLVEDDHWKRVRSITSPAFTSGKLRLMQPIFQKNIDKLVAYFDRLVELPKENLESEPSLCSFSEKGGVMDTKKVLSGYAIDSIASAAFAIETNTNDDQITENPLVSNALKWLDVSALQILSGVVMPLWFNNLIGVRHLVNNKVTEYMVSLAKEMVQKRKDLMKATGSEKFKNRGDLLQLLIDAEVDEEVIKKCGYNHLTADMSREDESSLEKVSLQKSGNIQLKNRLTENEVAAQCLLFFAGGFDTTSNALTHLIFELSHDQTSQDKLVKELKGALDHLDPTSEEYYETVTSSKNCTLPFMNACISETLRKYPPTNRLERRCSKAGYKVGGVQLEKDQLVEIPIYAVHYNSDYFSEPMIFKPERFLSENAHLLVPYTYMPFGLGPRNCVAMRFAYQEIKMCIATVFRKFRFQATPKTPKVLGFCTLQFFFTTKPFETFVTRR